MAGIKTTPAAQGSSTGTPDCHTTYLSTMKRDADGKLGSEVLYKMYKEEQRKEQVEAASKGNATKDRDTPKRKNVFKPIAAMDLEQYCKSGWSDRIGLEKVSQSKKDDFTGIGPCRK